MLGGRVALRTSAVDVLSDEVLQQLCICLAGRDLLRFSAAAKPLHLLTSESSSIWSHLSHALLGDTLCTLHTAFAERIGHAADTAFWRSLFREGQQLRLARWSPNLRSAFLQSLPVQSEEERREKILSATEGSGHCVVGIGRLLVKVGGFRPQCTLDHMHTAVFDLKEFAIRELQLTMNSERPERRLRHAACEIRPDLTSGRPAVLVLGGCSDRTREPCNGGLQLLHILEILNEIGTSGRWHSVPATGQAPRSIWHHMCGSFAFGRKVVVFGGDFNTDDPEFPAIADRSLPADFVYVLDVTRLVWERTVTSGPAPTWRSLHSGFTHRDVSSHSERLVILGGCAENLPIFSSSNQLAPMHGHALDLSSFRWLPQPSETPNLPPARLRLAAEKIGEWLLLYGGHGHSPKEERSQLHKLNLRTLHWSTLEVRGREGSHPAAPSSTMTSGLVLGGTKISVFGVSTVPKLDVLSLGGMGVGNDEDQGMQDDQTDEGEEEDDDLSDAENVVVVRTGTGEVIALPRAMAELLMGVNSRGVVTR